jgi:copper chaperone
MTVSQISFEVPTISCGHCVAAITEELEQVPGVVNVNVDLDTKVVLATGADLDSDVIRAAIEAAGYATTT